MNIDKLTWIIIIGSIPLSITSVLSVNFIEVKNKIKLITVPISTTVKTILLHTINNM